ncbi:MAG: sigma-70 family RNA polymerase sigma factor [Desulfobulbaceae bacterium]|nr:sigma-70 family RNA polymerase sigma factor [Desulfobulbaceae bacterium]
MELFTLAACLFVTVVLLNNPAGHLRQDDEPATETTELVRAWRNGDPLAFNRLVQTHQFRIYNLALNYVKTQEEAKDLAQDIFVTVYRSLPTLRDETKFSAWLYQLAINHCRNRYRRLQRQGYFSSSSIDDTFAPELVSTDNPARELEQKEQDNLVRTVIAAMPETEKEILILRDLQELSYEEISEALGLPLGTVKSKLNRARTSFKNRIKLLLRTP